MIFVVWMMEDGVPNSFTKLFTICTPDKNVLTILEFRKSGEPIIESIERSRGRVVDSSLLVVYDPYSKHFHNTWKHYCCLINQILLFITKIKHYIQVHGAKNKSF
ncbi:hypothetical protein Hanom_Chr15g01412961 [Helianthus anomalus]